MPCSEASPAIGGGASNVAAAPAVAPRRGWRSALRAVVGLALVLATGLAGAHKASDSYLQITAAAGKLDVRWDIALRDLDVALDLLVFAQAARASGRKEAIEEARRLKASIGLHDRRIDGLL